MCQWEKYLCCLSPSDQLPIPRVGALKGRAFLKHPVSSILGYACVTGACWLLLLWGPTGACARETVTKGLPLSAPSRCFGPVGHGSCETLSNTPSHFQCSSRCTTWEVENSKTEILGVEWGGGAVRLLEASFTPPPNPNYFES